MEYIACKTCGLQYEKSIEITHKILNKHLAASTEYYCEQCKTQ